MAHAERRAGPAVRVGRPPKQRRDEFAQREEPWQIKLRHDFVVRLLENRLEFGEMLPHSESDACGNTTKMPGQGKG